MLLAPLAQDEIGELDIPVPELCDQSNLGIDHGQSSTSVPQPIFTK